MMREQSFTADAKIADINPYVDVPQRVVEALGGRRKVKVLVKVVAADGTKKQSTGASPASRVPKDTTRLKAIGRLASGGWFRSTVLARRSSASRLYLDKWMRQEAGVGVGDRVRVALRPDLGSRELPVPALLGEALGANRRAKAAWNLLAPGRPHEILTYLNFLKTPVALKRNVEKTVASLVAKTHRRD